MYFYVKKIVLYAFNYKQLMGEFFKNVYSPSPRSIANNI